MTMITNELTDKEKILIMRNTFLENKNELNTIKNIGNYLADNFNKIDGFQYKWNSLITNNPLLFEDVDYVRVKQYVKNEITDEERDAYKRGELKDLYATFESMLMCNLQYYERIMNFCTMVFLHYVRISEDDITTKNLDDIPYIFEMTPTQIWCAALTNTTSSEWELNYAWSENKRKLDLKQINNDKSLLENNWDIIYRNKTFAKFVEYSSYRKGTVGFRETLIHDKISNKRLAQVCAKFTTTSTAISETQLNTISDYIKEQEYVNKRLYVSLVESLTKMFNGDSTKFSVYVYNTEFYIHSSKFSIKVIKSDTGKITKEYLANSYECFIAEEGLQNSIREQIEWAKYKLPIEYNYEKQILTSLLNGMLKEDYKEIVCIKRMNSFGIVSKITFQGIFNNVYVVEEFMVNNKTIRSERVCYSKSNAAKYIVDRGYYIFGLSNEVGKFDDLTKTNIIKHYMNYCVPVMQHMYQIITTYMLLKNDIIDVVVSGILNPHKINNKNIKYTNIRSDINARKLMGAASGIGEKALKSFSNTRKSYWDVINKQ